MNAWTVVPAPVPADLDSPDAWALHGAAAVTHALETALWGYPDLMYPPPYLLAELRAQEYVNRTLLVAVPTGATPTAADVAGTAIVEMPRKDNTHLAYAEVYVHPDRVRSGVGTALLSAAERLAADDGRRTVIAWSEHAGEPPADAPGVLEPPTGSGRIAHDDAGARFALRGGYTFEQAERYSVLHLPVGPEHLAALHSEAQTAAGSQYRLVTWEDRAPEEWVEQFAVLETRMSTAAPTAALEIQEATWDVARIRTREAAIADSGCGYLLVAAEHVPSRTLAAFTFVRYPKPWPEIVFQEDTMVLPEHRGRRLGMLVKTDLLRRLRTVRPEAARIHTWNAEENAHMLAINVALGFRPTGVVGMWQKHLAAIESSTTDVAVAADGETSDARAAAPASGARSAQPA